jgi:uncharacterized protein YrzB (UPF0473 family)
MANKFDTPDEDMTVTITLDDDTEVTCDVVTILTVEDKDYIVVLPTNTNGRFPEDEVWIYGYSENPENPDDEPELIYIDDEDEYEKVADAFDEYLDALDFDDDEE